MAKVIITIGAIATVTWFAATATGVKKWESDKPLESLPARSKSGKKHGCFQNCIQRNKAGMKRTRKTSMNQIWHLKQLA